jgi:hypothetical protein
MAKWYIARRGRRCEFPSSNRRCGNRQQGERATRLGGSSSTDTRSPQFKREPAHAPPPPSAVPHRSTVEFTTNGNTGSWQHKGRAVVGHGSLVTTLSLVCFPRRSDLVWWEQSPALRKATNAPIVWSWVEMKNGQLIFAFCLLSLTCSYGQMTIISAPAKDPEMNPEQRTATIVHYENMRLTARRTIGVLALALQNTEGSSKARLNEAINNEHDIVDWANWCIVALRDKTADALTCASPPGLRDGAGSESICQVAENPLVRSRCSQRLNSAKHRESTD